MTAARRMPKLSAPEPPQCPNLAEHTPAPEGYVGWYAWAEAMNRAHEQRQCPGCGLWAIWFARPAGVLACCWRCGERRVDPAFISDDEDFFCGECAEHRQAEVYRVEHRQAQQQRKQPEPEPGLALARETELALRTVNLPPSFPYESEDWKAGRGWVRSEQHLPGWTIDIPDDTTIRVHWHAGTNIPYRIKQLTKAADAIEAAGLRVARVDDEDGRILRLVVSRARAKRADAV